MKYIVFKTSSGKYGVKKEDGVRATKTFDNEEDAKKYAEEMTKKSNQTTKKDNKTTSKSKPSTKQNDNLITKEVKKQAKKAKRKMKKIIISIITLIIVSLISFVFYKYIYPRFAFNPIQAMIGTVYDDFQIHFMQIGNNRNGDAIYIKAGDNDILIDAGNENTSTIKNYMNNYVKDNKLEYLIVTHSDADHLDGIVGTNKEPGILDSYEIDTLIDFNYVVSETELYKN